MVVARVFGKALFAVLYAAPLAWLLCFAAFLIAVIIKVGHFPSYSDPDPKHVAGLSTPHLLTVVFLFVALASPVVLGARAITTWLRRLERRGAGWQAAAYLLTVTLAGFIIAGDAFGLRTWFLD
jgi:hypothetical protein